MTRRLACVASVISSVLLCTLLPGWCRGDVPSTQGAQPATEHEAFLWAADPTPGSVAFSDDGRHIAWIAQSDGKQRVAFDGKFGELYDEVPWVRLSPQGGRLVYPAKSGTTWQMVVDGKEQPVGDTYPFDIRFSPDGGRVSYSVKLGKRRAAMVIDGIRGPEYPVVGLLAFSSDGKHTAYTAVKQGAVVMVMVVDGVEEKAKTEDPRALYTPGASRVVQRSGGGGLTYAIDGKPCKVYQGLGEPVFSPDGKQVAFWAMTLDAAGKLKWRVVTNAVEGPALDGTGELPGVRSGAMVFSPDGKHLAYVGRRGTIRKDAKWILVADDRQVGEYEGVGQIVYSPDGKQLAYSVERQGAWSVVVDGKSEDVFDRVIDLCFSADGKEHWYRAMHKDTWTIVVNGQRGATYEQVGPPYEGEDGNIKFLAVKEGKVWQVTRASP